MSVHRPVAPYRCARAPGTSAREELGDLACTHAGGRTRPGSSALVTARQVLTPLDLERDYGLTGGHPLHGEPALDQFFAWRPLLGHARYRLPLDGLYLCGSGAHPGGGITGQPGRTRPARSWPTAGSGPASALPACVI